MALEEDLGGAMTITAVSWQRSGEGEDSGTYGDVSVHMGISGSDDLTPYFDANYIPGTRTLVFETDSLYLEAPPGEWVQITLDQPFQYPGSGNLVIEIQRSGTWDATVLMTWRWYSKEYRTVSAPEPDAVVGYRDQVSSMLLIEYLEGLASSSWGGVKRSTGVIPTGR